MVARALDTVWQPSCAPVPRPAKQLLGLWRSGPAFDAAPCRPLLLAAPKPLLMLPAPCIAGLLPATVLPKWPKQGDRYLIHGEWWQYDTERYRRRVETYGYTVRMAQQRRPKEAMEGAKAYRRAGGGFEYRPNGIALYALSSYTRLFAAP